MNFKFQFKNHHHHHHHHHNGNNIGTFYSGSCGLFFDDFDNEIDAVKNKK